MSKPFEKATGVYRGNPNISYNNALKVDAATAGTAGTDTVEIDVETPPTAYTGIDYTGADGVTTFYRFFDQEYPSGQRIEKDVPYSQTDTATIVEEILKIVERHEIGATVTATFAAGTPDTMTIVHVGSGTIDNIYTDGSATAGVRS